MHGVLASLWLSACFLVCCVCAGTVDAAIGQTVTFLELHGATIHHRVIYRQEGLRGDGQPFSNQNTIDTRPRSTTLIETDEETNYGFPHIAQVRVATFCLRDNAAALCERLKNKKRSR